MSFLFETFATPLWFLLFVFGCAIPLWIKWSKLLYKKYILKFYDEELDDSSLETIDILKKATDGWNASVDHNRKTAALKKTGFQHSITTKNQPYVKIVLKTLALNGDAGMLIQSIADDLNITSNEINSSLSYLEKNEFVEAVLGGNGTKYYLAERGKQYCIKRGYIKD